ncbi:MAG: thioesterase II family protein [Geminicoccaceae bacterium]
MARLKLVCLPFAGAGIAPFWSWPRALPASIELYAAQLPGREDRLREPALDTFAEMHAALIDAIAKLPPGPLALFGHSMGAVMALEVARVLCAAASPRVTHVMCAARPWPGVGSGDFADLASIDDDDRFIDALARRYGVRNAALDDRELRALALPALRADLRLLADYRWQPASPLTCPLTVYSGKDDPITREADMRLWQRESAAAFDHVQIAGRHFFLDTHKQALIDDISARLCG